MLQFVSRADSTRTDPRRTEMGLMGWASSLFFALSGSHPVKYVVYFQVAGVESCLKPFLAKACSWSMRLFPSRHTH